ncbi:MAG: hypothetical protein Hals2KO_32570 [Halioglobus sp.]
MTPDVHFVTLLLLFAVAYFCVVLPLFQLISLRVRGRKFVIRLGTPWKFSNPEHRWDVLLSFLSFVVTLGISFFVLDFFFPLAEV